MMPACAVAHALPVTDVYATAHEHFDYLIAQLHSPEVHQMTHSELEALLEVEGRELLRRLLQAHLDERSPGTVAAPVLDADGHPCAPQRCHTRHLMTLFGEVEVVRMGYGGRSTPSLHPLDAALNLPPERYSHRVRQRVAAEAAKNSFDDVVATLTTTSGAHVPKRQTEQLVVRAAQDFEVFYATQRCAIPEAVQDTSAVLVLSVDSKGVPMRTADLRAATRRAATAHQAPRGSRRPQGERGHTKRMATVATVYTIAPWVRTPADIRRELQSVPLAATARPRPEGKRVWASVAQSMADVIRQAFEEARRRDPQHTKQWVALVDGNPTQLGLLSEMATEYDVELRIGLDLIHVLEYVWKAAKAFHPRAPLAAATWVTARLEDLLRGRSRQVAASLRRRATERRLTETQRAPVEQCAHYLSKYADFLHYDASLAAGFPIATGVIEGACRHLVKDRMEVTGARWSLAGAEAVLRLRSLWSSGDFEAYWAFHLEQEFKRHHAAHYARGNAPTPTAPVKRQERGSHLQLVK
jgi:hypothetical protein